MSEKNKQRKKLYYKVIESDLRTYHLMKKTVSEIIQEADEMSAPSATDIRESVYTHSKQVSFAGGFNVSIVIGTETRTTSDPTPQKASEIARYLSGTGYREMVRHIEAIEYVLSLLGERAAKGDTDSQAKLKLIEEKYFKGHLTDAGIFTQLQIAERTFYRWKNDILYLIAERLGYIF